MNPRGTVRRVELVLEVGVDGVWPILLLLISKRIQSKEQAQKKRAKDDGGDGGDAEDEVRVSRQQPKRRGRVLVVKRPRRQARQQRMLRLKPRRLGWPADANGLRCWSWLTRMCLWWLSCFGSHSGRWSGVESAPGNVPDARLTPGRWQALLMIHCIWKPVLARTKGACGR